MLHQLTGVIALHKGNITSVDIVEERQTYLEIDVIDGPACILEDLSKLPIVKKVTQVKTFQTVFGKRMIIIGGGRQVAAGAISEADLLVTDPLQAGVMTMMAVAETAKFSVARLKNREF